MLLPICQFCKVRHSLLMSFFTIFYFCITLVTAAFSQQFLFTLNQLILTLSALQYSALFS